MMTSLYLCTSGRKLSLWIHLLALQRERSGQSAPSSMWWAPHTVSRQNINVRWWPAGAQDVVPTSCTPEQLRAACSPEGAQSFSALIWSKTHFVNVTRWIRKTCFSFMGCNFLNLQRINQERKRLLNSRDTYLNATCPHWVDKLL